MTKEEHSINQLKWLRSVATKEGFAKLYRVDVFVFDVAIKAIEKQEKIKEAFENWEIDTSGFFEADDETTEFIFAVKKIVKAGAEHET